LTDEKHARLSSGTSSAINSGCSPAGFRLDEVIAVKRALDVREYPNIASRGSSKIFFLYCNLCFQTPKRVKMCSCYLFFSIKKSSYVVSKIKFIANNLDSSSRLLG